MRRVIRELIKESLDSENLGVEEIAIHMIDNHKDKIHKYKDPRLPSKFKFHKFWRCNLSIHNIYSISDIEKLTQRKVLPSNDSRMFTSDKIIIGHEVFVQVYMPTGEPESDKHYEIMNVYPGITFNLDKVYSNIEYSPLDHAFRFAEAEGLRTHPTFGKINNHSAQNIVPQYVQVKFPFDNNMKKNIDSFIQDLQKLNPLGTVLNDNMIYSVKYNRDYQLMDTEKFLSDNKLLKSLISNFRKHLNKYPEYSPGI